MTAMKCLHDCFKADLISVCDILDAKLTDIQKEQKKLIVSIDSLSKSTENLHPVDTHIQSISMTCDSSLLLMLNIKETADWLRELNFKDKFLDKFAIEVCIRDRSISLLLWWMPITFDSDNRKHYREIKKVNKLPVHSVQKFHWIR